jgi:hypothetical protein
MIPAFFLILAAVAYRIVTGFAITSGTTWLSNFAPLAAIALCDPVLPHHKYVRVVERSGLREKFREPDPVAHGRFAPIQRDANLDVFS